MAKLSIRDKNVMVDEVKDSYAQVKDSWQTAIEKSISCGGKLVYYKSQIEHGRWQKFLEACGIPPRTATGMMRMHEHRELLRAKSAENWVEAVRIIQAETNPNRQRIADLTVSKPVETDVPKIENQIATASQELEKDSPSHPAFEPNRQYVADLAEASDEYVEDEQEGQQRANQATPSDLMYYSAEEANEEQMTAFEEMRLHLKAKYRLPKVSGEWTSWFPINGSTAIMVEMTPVVERPGFFSVSIFSIDDCLLVRSYVTHAGCLDRSIDDALVELFSHRVSDFGEIVDTLARVSVAKYMVGLKEDDDAMASFLGELADQAGSNVAAIEMLKIMTRALELALIGAEQDDDDEARNGTHQQDTKTPSP